VRSSVSSDVRTSCRLFRAMRHEWRRWLRPSTPAGGLLGVTPSVRAVAYAGECLVEPRLREGLREIVGRIHLEGGKREAVERCHEDDEGPASVFTEACQIESILERHPNVQESDVGLEHDHRLARIGAVMTLGDDLDVAVALEQLTQRAAR